MTRVHRWQFSLQEMLSWVALASAAVFIVHTVGVYGAGWVVVLLCFGIGRSVERMFSAYPTVGNRLCTICAIGALLSMCLPALVWRGGGVLLSGVMCCSLAFEHAIWGGRAFEWPLTYSNVGHVIFGVQVFSMAVASVNVIGWPLFRRMDGGGLIRKVGRLVSVVGVVGASAMPALVRGDFIWSYGYWLWVSCLTAAIIMRARNRMDLLVAIANAVVLVLVIQDGAIPAARSGSWPQ
jgi:hypothetical protein